MAHLTPTTTLTHFEQLWSAHLRRPPAPVLMHVTGKRARVEMGTLEGRGDNSRASFVLRTPLYSCVHGFFAHAPVFLKGLDPASHPDCALCVILSFVTISDI